jgi:GT2 family glycosyltransferase
MWLEAARIAGKLRPRRRVVSPLPARSTEAGITVVIPSRNGRDLLAAQREGIGGDLASVPSEIIVVDNGSDDGTAAWLREHWPDAVVEVSVSPLSFSRAVNRGIERARFSHVCLLNNDMILEPGFFAALQHAFSAVPDLFCATAQIFFPEGVRREETGKAFMSPAVPDDFPVRCDEPLGGEDLSYVLYGSGGCSLYETAKLRLLGGMDPAYDPVYVEDLDSGYRAWQRGWPSVFVAGARLEHRHRATTSRYFTPQQLDDILEINYLKFLVRAVHGRAVFQKLWAEALARLEARKSPVLQHAWRLALSGGGGGKPAFAEELIIALGSGTAAVFPGRAPLDRVPVLHTADGLSPTGGLLVAYADRLETPPAEVLDACTEVVVVKRDAGPAAFRAAVEMTERKWKLQKHD